MNTAAKGRRAEHRSRALLEAAGFTVIRAAASKGDFDPMGYSGRRLGARPGEGRPPAGADRAPGPGRGPVPASLCQRVVHVWRPRACVPETIEL